MKNFKCGYFWYFMYGTMVIPLIITSQYIGGSIFQEVALTKPFMSKQLI